MTPEDSELLSMVELDNSSDYAEDLDGWLSYYTTIYDGKHVLIVDFTPNDGGHGPGIRRRTAFRVVPYETAEWVE